MKRLNMETSKVKQLVEVKEKEALEFLNGGKAVVCQVHPREFLQLTTSTDLFQCKRLWDAGIYDSFKLFLQ